MTSWSPPSYKNAITSRAAPNTGIGISIRPIPAFFGGIGIGKQVPILLLIPYMYYYNEFL